MSAFILPLVIVIGVCLLLLIVLVIVCLGISGRLKRVEAHLAQSGQGKGVVDSADYGPSATETSPGGAFEAFLNEDPERREMTKGEQFAAYRQWRHEKGMNWSNS